MRTRLFADLRRCTRGRDLPARQALQLACEVLSEAGDLGLAHLGVGLGRLHHCPRQTLVGRSQAATGGLGVGVSAKVKGAPADIVGEWLQTPALGSRQAMPARVDRAGHSHSQDRGGHSARQPHACDLIPEKDTGPSSFTRWMEPGSWGPADPYSEPQMVHRTTRGLAVGTLALLACAGPAAATPRISTSLTTADALTAQAGRLTVGRYGGGAAGRPIHLVTVRLAGGRRSASQTAMLTPRCRGAIRPKLLDTIRLTQILLRQRGRYVYQSPYEETVPADVPEIGGLKRTGTMRGSARIGSGGQAAGVLRNTFTLRDPGTGEVRARCDTFTVRWSARVPPRSAGGGRSAPQWGAAYFGLTGQRLPSVLEVGGRGRALTRARVAFQIRCPGALGRPVALESIGARIAKGRGKRRVGAGAFRDSGRETRTVSSSQGQLSASLRWRLTGRFGAEGVAGTWGVTVTLSRHDTGELVTECKPVTVRWRAVG